MGEQDGLLPTDRPVGGGNGWGRANMTIPIGR